MDEPDSIGNRRSEALPFIGKLVPTEAELARREGRSYEPANALLERIKTQRAERETGARRGPRRAGS